MLPPDLRAGYSIEIQSPRERLAGWLKAASIEITPTDNSMKKIDSISPETSISVTHLPKHDIGHVAKFAVNLARSGRSVVPHIAASRVSRGQALEAASLLRKGGIDNIFVIRGDNHDRSLQYPSTIVLLRDLHTSGIRFKAVGVAGHPEGHTEVSYDALNDALLEKQEFASEAGVDMRIVTQMCFDPEKIISWVDDIRSKGVNLPVIVGIPGPLGMSDLIMYSLKCGISSVKFLESNPRLSIDLGSNAALGFDPRSLLSELAELTTDDHGIKGVHFFPFGNISGTFDLIKGDQ